MQSPEDIEDLKNHKEKFLFNLTQNFRKSLIIFDIRSKEKFEIKHFKESLHIPIQHPFTSNFSLSDLRLLYPQNNALQKLRRYCIVIGSDSENSTIAKNLEILLKSHKCRELYLFDEEYEEFLNRYPFLTEGSGVPLYPMISCGYPNEIIPKFLYLGSHFHAENYDVIKILNITHIINATRNVKNAFKGQGVKYCRVFVEDNAKEKISYHFHKAFKFIEEAKQINEAGGQTAVLVHCAQGVSRSATIVAMFLMKEYDISFEQSAEYLKKQRFVVEPNQGFVKQLKQFEARKGLFSRSNSMDLGNSYSPYERKSLG
ncbi:unnamed protein product [Blepharisma stoltei]|uniref:protein-tyrosine-phosphatase n=1 Tax=Blepharisma stoltei TaxID=1481888 RepID=A0AAU9I9D5_9CILI|nr:unnamed protein product [Blepharisma stoltei]